MKFYTKTTTCDNEFSVPKTRHSEATLDDIKAYLAEQGLVAVPVDLIERMAGDWNYPEVSLICEVTGLGFAIKASGEGNE